METLRRNEIWVFFAAILIINALFIGAISADILPMGLYGYGRFLLLGGVLVSVVFALRGLDGVADLLRPMLHWRVAPVWYLLALVWGAGNMVLFLVAKGLLAGDGLGAVSANLGLVSRPSVMAIVLVSSLIGEIVWISYAVRKLSDRFTIYVSAMITGLVWTLWWLPMVILNIGIVTDLPLLALLINQTGVAAVAAFLYWHTRSGLVVLIGQILFNASLLVFPVAPSTGGVATYYAFSATFFLTALALYLVKGPRPLFSSGGSVPARA